MTKKEIIKRNFSRFALLYDRYSEIQCQCGLILISMLRDRASFKDILEIGCGTGNFTLLLKKAFPQSMIKACDISDEMLNIARKKIGTESIEFFIRDGEYLSVDSKFDLITSNACFQWFDDIVNAVSRYKALLKYNGVILFSVFGQLTFRELNESLSHLFPDSIRQQFIPYTEQYMRMLMRGLFGSHEFHMRIFQREYSSLRELLEHIKFSGIRGTGFGRIWTPRIIDRLESIYIDKFGKITATYQVFFCKAHL